ncbi:hypothetical protein L6452_39927 [Arctium lappa]|uniref:Uncharacterized protein n=1 Tax=Arctium lappa TaxID=4217 RepID=A0ACB8XU56_ARCLA|nr:hypothetical protein L6452_39927 [Arctium lappa]
MSKPNPTPPPTFKNPNPKPTWYHHLWAAAGCTTALFSLSTTAVHASTDPYTSLKTIFAGLIGYFFIDLISSIYHWTFDNYGDSSTPLLGPHIDTFRSHHELPWATTRTQFSTNLYAPAVFNTIVVLPMSLMWYDQPVVMGFVGVVGVGILFSAQIHVWAHQSKGKLPVMVVAMQNAGVVLGQSRHASHHRSFDRDYGIVSGNWDRVLDEYKVFLGLEKVVFLLVGVKPMSWSEGKSGGGGATAVTVVEEDYVEMSPS